MTVWIAWCEQVNFGRTYMKAEDVFTHTGYRSVYGVRSRMRPVSVDFKHTALFSDTLFMDFDKGIDGPFEDTVKFLQSENINFEAYFSGKKGGHIHVEIVPMYGHNIPETQLAFVESLGIPCDPAIYRPAQLIRLPGTQHRETNKTKSLLSQLKSGQKLYIPMNESKFNKLEIPPMEETTLRFALNNIASKLGKVKPGKRQDSLYSAAKGLFENNVSRDTATELLFLLNDSWDSPKPDDEVLRALNSVYPN